MGTFCRPSHSRPREGRPSPGQVCVAVPSQVPGHVGWPWWVGGLAQEPLVSRALRPDNSCSGGGREAVMGPGWQENPGSRGGLSGCFPSTRRKLFLPQLASQAPGRRLWRAGPSQGRRRPPRGTVEATGSGAPLPPPAARGRGGGGAPGSGPARRPAVPPARAPASRSPVVPRRGHGARGSGGRRRGGRAAAGAGAGAGRRGRAPGAGRPPLTPPCPPCVPPPGPPPPRPRSSGPGRGAAAARCPSTPSGRAASVTGSPPSPS